MKYIASVLLAQLAGNQSPSAADITKILSSVGIETDAARIDALLNEISGKSIDELISSGISKLGSVSVGGGAAAAPAAAAAAASAGGKQDKAPAKKQESEEEEEEMGLGLFD